MSLQSPSPEPNTYIEALHEAMSALDDLLEGEGQAWSEQVRQRILSALSEAFHSGYRAAEDHYGRSPSSPRSVTPTPTPTPPMSQMSSPAAPMRFTRLRRQQTEVPSPPSTKRVWRP
jgi:hypothetical protein